jgi:hypothetical protein
METAALTSKELIQFELKQATSTSSYIDKVFEFKNLKSKSYSPELNFMSDCDLIQDSNIRYIDNSSFEYVDFGVSLFDKLGFNFNAEASLLQVEIEIRKLGLQVSPWSSDDIKSPNSNVIKLAINVSRKLAEYKILNYGIKPSIEEGIAFIFKSKNRKMYFEFYNDGENGFIIEDYVHKKIIANKNVNSLSEIVINILNFIR